MIERILPRTADNSFRGHSFAVWLMILIIAIKSIQGLTSMFISLAVAQGAHNYAVNTYPTDARQLLVVMFQRLGLSVLVLMLFCVLVLIRYRALIPVTYVLLLVQQTGSAILQLKESAIAGTSSATVVGFVLLLLTLAGLVASLRRAGITRVI